MADAGPPERPRSWLGWPVRWGTGVVTAPFARLFGRGWRRVPESGADDASARQWLRVEEAFHGAVGLTGAERKEWLDRICAGDPMLRAEVESLLEADRTIGPFDRLGDELGRAVLRSIKADEPAPLALDRYRILDRLAGGGMGVVYRARDERLQRDVALKFLPSERVHDIGAKERFVHEARAAAGLDHPNICTIHEIGETADGQLFIAMPLYDGSSVSDRIAAGALRVEDAVDIATQVLDGLAAAAGHGIVHRDIKPANLILTTTGLVKVVDFGLAKLQGAERTGPGRRLGTVAYMSPEQARGDNVDTRSDLWSVGVVLYEMLTGVRPFRGGTDDVILAAIDRADAEPIRQLRSNVPDSLATFVHRLLRREPGERFASAHAAAWALRAAATEPSATASLTISDSVPPEGERRAITVLACTIDGLARAAEKLPADGFAALQARLRNEIADSVLIHGGRVQEQSNESGIALFGLPVGHGDDPVRAARAALRIRTEVAACGGEAGIGEINARISIATGNVVARGSQSGDLDITGEVVPMVRSICALAARGRILVDDRTRRRLLHMFDLRPVATGPAIIDGHPPLDLFVVDCEIGTGSRFDSIADERLTAFQGRDEELGLLRRELRYAQSGSGRLVVVEGDAGLGKSRLVYEFRKTLPENDTRFVFVRCHAHGAGTPYRPLAEALRALLRLPADAGADASARERASQRLLDIDLSLEVYLPLLLKVLGIPGGRFAGSEQIDEPEFRTMAAEAIATTLTLAAGERSIVLVVEDVHWADAASLGALVRLNDLIGTSSLLAVLTSRPGPHVDQLRSDSGVRLRLDPLAGPAARAVVASALRSNAVHPDLAEQIELRAGGNPFFIEELCAAFIEEDAARVVDGRAILIRKPDELPTPDSVHAVLAGRLDRLPLAERRMVRFASVFGSEFRRSVLEAVWDGTDDFEATLEAVRGSGMIHKATVLPEPLFRFRHALIRDVAYAGLLEHQRRDLHRRVGEALEASTRGADSAGALAAHFANAEQWSKAIRYAREAGEAAAVLKEPRETLRNLEAAYEWSSRLEPDERRPIQVELLLEREKFYETVGDRVQQAQVIDEVFALLPEGENPGARAEAFRRKCDLEALCGRHEQALDAIQEADRLCVLAGDSRLELRVLRSRTHLHWRNSEYQRAQDLAEQLIARDPNGEDHRSLIMDLQNLASIVIRNGDIERARLILEEKIRPMAENSGNPLDRINLLYQLGKVYSQMGLVERALASHREVAAMPEMRTLPEEHGYQHLAISGLLLTLDRIDESIVAAREAVRLMRRVKHAEAHAHASRNLAELLVNVGRPDEAIPELSEALDLFARIQDQPMVHRLRLLRARTLELAGKQTDALDEWARIRDEAHHESDVTNEILALEAMSRCSETSDPAGARQLASDALELAERAGDQPAAARLTNRLAVLAWRRNEFDVTIEYYERAANAYRTLGDSRSLAVVLNGLGATRRRCGFLRPARDALLEAIQISRENAASADLANGLAALSAVLEESGDPGGGRAALEEALQIRRGLGQSVECGWTLLKLARIAPAAGAQTRDQWLSEASRIAREHRDTELLRACGEVAVL